MPEGNIGPYSQGATESPLSSAFRQAWQDWLDSWDELGKREADDAQLVLHAVEEAIRITRRLWRSAFASVGDSAGAQVRAMVYAFVALLDETLLFSSWVGQAAWQERPLEARLYGSRNAGERLPVAIKQLLDERAPATRDLANVYLQCLILGFHGRLRGEHGKAIHEKWRHTLFAFAWQRDPTYTDVVTLLEQPTLVSPQRLPLRRALPDGLRLFLAVAAMLLVLTVIGQLFWGDIVGELEPAMNLAMPPLLQGGHA